jgi:hypothetical protein
LTGIEHRNVGKTAEPEPPIRMDIGPARDDGATHRHMLVPSLKCRRTAEQERLGGRIGWVGVAAQLSVTSWSSKLDRNGQEA